MGSVSQILATKQYLFSTSWSVKQQSENEIVNTSRGTVHMFVPV